MDIAIEGLLHLKVLRSPHAHARITRIDRTKALRRAGRRRRLHLGRRAAPALQHRAARGPSRRSRRHLHAGQRRALRGQRIAAVVGETEAAAEAGCRALRGRVRDPAGGLRSGGGHGARRAACCTTRTMSSTQNDNIFCTLQGEIGDVAKGFKEADAVHEMTYSTSRVQHVHLETHGSIAWKGEDGRWHVRTSSQGPFAARTKLAYLMGMPARDMHVFTERVGGGFGGKQEMMSEDLPLFATMKLRPPGEMGMDPRRRVHRRHDAAPDDDQGQDRRQEGRHADRARRPCRVQHRRLRQPRQRDPGRRDGEPARGLSLRQQEGRRPRRLHQHDPGRRLQRLRRLADDLRDRMRHRRAGAACSASIRSRCGARTSCGPATTSNSIWKEPSDASFGSYGIDRVPRHRRDASCKKGNGVAKPEGDDWAEGTGMALAMLECGPPTEHRSGAEMKLLPDGTYHLACGSSEMGNGITTAHKQIAASIVGVRAPRRRHHQRRHRPHALRHRHLRQHRHGGGGQGRPSHRRGDARRHPRLRRPSHRRRARQVPARQRRGRLRQQADPAHASSMPPAPRSTIASRSAAGPTCRRARSPSTCRACGSRCTRSPARSASCTACMPPTSACRSTPCSAAASSMAPSPWATAGR